jgi:hypothetical protein
MNWFGQQYPFDLSNERMIRKKTVKKCRLRAAFFDIDPKQVKISRRFVLGKNLLITRVLFKFVLIGYRIYLCSWDGGVLGENSVSLRRHLDCQP